MTWRQKNEGSWLMYTTWSHGIPRTCRNLKYYRETNHEGSWKRVMCSDGAHSEGDAHGKRERDRRIKCHPIGSPLIQRHCRWVPVGSEGSADTNDKPADDQRTQAAVTPLTWSDGRWHSWPPDQRLSFPVHQDPHYNQYISRCESSLSSMARRLSDPWSSSHYQK